MGPVQGPWAMEDDSDFESQLREAAMQVERTGNEKPLIMAELKTKIQLERVKKGLPELKVEFEQPRTYELTEEERNNKKKRQLRNRDAAKKSRNRKKVELEVLSKTNSELQSRNSLLASDVKELKQLVHKLKKGVSSARICSRSYSTRASKQVPFMLQSNRQIVSLPSKGRQCIVRNVAPSPRSSAAAAQYGKAIRPRPYPLREQDFNTSLGLDSWADQLISTASSTVSSSSSSCTTTSSAYSYEGDQLSEQQNNYSVVSPSAYSAISSPSTSPPLAIPVVIPGLFNASDEGRSFQPYMSPMTTTSPPAYDDGQVYQQGSLHIDTAPHTRVATTGPLAITVDKYLLQPEQIDLTGSAHLDKLISDSGLGFPSPPVPAPSVSPDHLSDPQHLFRVMQGLNRGA